MTVEKQGFIRWLPYVLLVLVLVGAFAVGGRSRAHPSLTERTLSVAATIKCPECTDKSMAASDAPTSVAGRTEIRRQLAAGQSPNEIRTWFAARYGTSVLLTPSRSGIEGLIWIIPVVMFVIAVAGVTALFMRWRRVGTGVLSAEDQDLVDEARRQDPGSA